MNDKQYRSLARYAGRIAKELGLGHYDLSIHNEQAGETAEGETAAASFEGTYGRYCGVIRVNKHFDHYAPEDQRVYIVHELLHAHTEAVREFTRSALAGTMGREAYEVFMAGYRQQDERFTDALATSIAPKFPLWDGK